MSWQERAACKGIPKAQAEWFHDRRTWALAKEFCQICPVRSECLDANREDRWSVVGGLDPEERGTAIPK